MPRQYTSRIPVPCAGCGTELSVWPSQVKRSRRIYCDRTCRYPGTETDRFWAKVEKNGPTPEHFPELGRCWIWLAARNYDGYGRFGYGGRVRMAHVVAYILTTGHEPPTETPKILHYCDGGATGCVRPSHLYAGTDAQNVADMIAKGREAPIETRLRRGEQHGRAKLGVAQVIEIRQRFAAGGITKQALADDYGVSDTQIGEIIRRTRWAHIE